MCVKKFFVPKIWYLSQTLHIFAPLEIETEY